MGKQCSFLIGWGTCHAPAVRDSSHEGVGGTSGFLSLVRLEALGPLEPPAGGVGGARPFSGHWPRLAVPQVSVQVLLPGRGREPVQLHARQPPSCWLGSHLEGQGLRGTGSRWPPRNPCPHAWPFSSGVSSLGLPGQCLSAFGPDSESPACR